MKIKQVAAAFVLLFIAWLLVQGWSGQRGLLQVRQLMEHYYKLVAQTNNLQEKNLTLQKEIKQLKGDDFWLEKQVREKIGWLKPGEVIYKFKNVETEKNRQQ